MLTEARIQNFKSIQRLQLSLGRVTVLIGENGSGKSNILEALALASAASQDKLDPEFLVSRGIRVAEPQFMRAAFPGSTDDVIEVSLQLGQAAPRIFRLRYEHEPSTGWRLRQIVQDRQPEEAPTTALSDEDQARRQKVIEIVDAYLASKYKDPKLAALATGAALALSRDDREQNDHLQTVLHTLLKRMVPEPFNALFTVGVLDNFLFYSPENSSLRTFEREGQIQPLGVRGEGLFKLLKTLSGPEHQDRWQDLRENLRLLDWFDDLRIAPNLAPYETTLQISDRYLAADRTDELTLLDQRSANEGFLFLLFYFALLVSKSTPRCFAIDNIDSSLNPKLCSELLRRLVLLAKKYDKQVILTTHNPAILDGLDLHDEEQRLFVVHRNSQGHTKVRRITPPQPLGDEPPVKLSEAFLRGILGGLPQNF